MFFKRPSDQVRALGAIPLLRDLNRSDLEAITRITHEITRQPGELLLRQGDIGSEMLVLLEGTARVEVDGNPIEEVAPNRIIGEMALLDNYRRSASVVAITPCTALVIPSEQFWSFLRHAPEVQRQLLITMSKRVRDLHEMLRAHDPAFARSTTETDTVET